MRRNRKTQLLFGHPAPVVAYTDKLPTAVFDGNGDLCRPGVDGIFDQLFDNTGRTLHNFTGRNFVDQQIRQDMDSARLRGHPCVRTLLKRFARFRETFASTSVPAPSIITACGGANSHAWNVFATIGQEGFIGNAKKPHADHRKLSDDKNVCNTHSHAMSNKSNGKRHRKIALRPQRDDLPEHIVEACGETGFDGIELVVDSTSPAEWILSHSQRFHLTRPPVIAVSAVCQTVSIEAEIPFVTATLAAASQTRATVLNLMLPPIQTPDHLHGFPRYQSAVNFLHRLLDATRFEAERFGVAIAVEVARGGCFLSPVEMRELIDVASSWSVGVCLDFARIENIGQYPDWMQTLNHRVHAVRISVGLQQNEKSLLNAATVLNETGFDRAVCVRCDLDLQRAAESLKKAGLLGHRA